MVPIVKRSRRILVEDKSNRGRCSPAPVSRSVAQRFVEQETIFFSWENRNAYWFGLVLTFSPSQLACFKVLWDNFLRGNLPIPNERILSGFRGETTHIYHLFKRHVAWKNVIVGDGRGNFWLRLPNQSVHLIGGFRNLVRDCAPVQTDNERNMGPTPVLRN